MVRRVGRAVESYPCFIQACLLSCTVCPPNAGFLSSDDEPGLPSTGGQRGRSCLVIKSLQHSRANLPKYLRGYFFMFRFTLSFLLPVHVGEQGAKGTMFGAGRPCELRGGCKRNDVLCTDQLPGRPAPDRALGIPAVDHHAQAKPGAECFDAVMLLLFVGLVWKRLHAWHVWRKAALQSFC